MTLHEYIEDMRGKRIAIIGIGVSNTPLLELLLAEGIRVTACDKRSREQMGEQAEHLEQLGCELHLGARVDCSAVMALSALKMAMSSRL